MTREKSIEAQIRRAEEILPKIEKEYQESLNEQTVSDDLKLDIQSFVGHLRSVLDYLANDIVETHCPNANSRDRLYFPITSDSANFTRVMNRSYPDLSANCPNLYNFLDSIQPYQNEHNKWLTKFNKVNNEQKHNDLMEQTRTETRIVKVSGRRGDSVSWGSGVTFGSGVSVMGVPIDPRTQMPVQNNMVKTEVKIWVDFKFDGIDVSVIWLLRESLNRIKEISTEIRRNL